MPRIRSTILIRERSLFVLPAALSVLQAAISRADLHHPRCQYASLHVTQYDVSSVTTQDCLQAVESAAKAFKTWKNTGAVERRAIFNKAAQLLQERKDEFVKLTVEETTGNPFWG